MGSETELIGGECLEGVKEGEEAIEDHPLHQFARDRGEGYGAISKRGGRIRTRFQYRDGDGCRPDRWNGERGEDTVKKV